ncbi:MAG: hypothetical protein QG650_935 [Patescibacteria group bacterium]|nr:hypothetical protein [Patescibacteria group bacterium]
MNAPANHAVRDATLQVSEMAETSRSGLRSAIIADRVSHNVRLLVGLVAGFGACTPIESIRDSIRRLGRSDAHLVLATLSEEHSRTRQDIELMHPELLELLRTKCS